MFYNFGLGFTIKNMLHHTPTMNKSNDVKYFQHKFFEDIKNKNNDFFQLYFYLNGKLVLFPKIKFVKAPRGKIEIILKY